MIYIKMAKLQKKKVMKKELKIKQQEKSWTKKKERSAGLNERRADEFRWT